MEEKTLFYVVMERSERLGYSTWPLVGCGISATCLFLYHYYYYYYCLKGDYGAFPRRLKIFFGSAVKKPDFIVKNIPQ